MKNKLGIYFHIPFCVRKCLYCDFCSYEKSDNALRTHYLEAMVRELLSYKGKLDNYYVDTIFFGGGTPTLLEASQMKLLLDTLGSIVEIDQNAEITSEANPKTADKKKLLEMREIGINRLSVGVQSFQDSELQTLGRIHTSKEAISFLHMAKEAGFDNLSLDLIYGIPGQTRESFNLTLKTALELEPKHISCYSLILEEGTPLYFSKEKYEFPDEDFDSDLYEICQIELQKKGFVHYEISNYAKEGYESRHNKKYWDLSPYIGFGVAAYSFFEGQRYGYPREIEQYLKDDFKTKYDLEIIDEKRRLEDEIMLGLRTRYGIAKETIKEDKKEVLKSLLDAGYLIETQDRIIPTDKGMYVSNEIILKLTEDI